MSNITNTTYKSFSTQITSVNKAADKLGILANMAAYQAVAHNNMDWLNRLFNGVNTMTLKSGELSKAGTELRAYIVAHAPGLRIEKAKDGKKAGEIVAKATKNEKNRGKFAAGKNDDGETILVDAKEKPEFALTFAQWREEKANKADKPEAPKKAATTMTKSVAALVDALKNKAYSGDYQALEALADMAAELQEAAATAYMNEKSRLENVNVKEAAKRQTGETGKVGSKARKAGTTAAPSEKTATTSDLFQSTKATRKTA